MKNRKKIDKELDLELTEETVNNEESYDHDDQSIDEYITKIVISAISPYFKEMTVDNQLLLSTMIITLQSLIELFPLSTSDQILDVIADIVNYAATDTLKMIDERRYGYIGHA